MKRADVIHIESMNDVIAVSNDGVEGSYRVDLRASAHNEVHIHISKDAWEYIAKAISRFPRVH